MADWVARHLAGDLEEQLVALSDKVEALIELLTPEQKEALRHRIFFNERLRAGGFDSDGDTDGN